MKLTEKIKYSMNESSASIYSSMARRVESLDDSIERSEEILNRAKKGQSSLEPDEVKDMQKNLNIKKDELRILKSMMRMYKRFYED